MQQCVLAVILQKHALQNVNNAMSEVDSVAKELDFTLVVTKKGKYRNKKGNNPRTHLQHQLADPEWADFCRKTIITQLQTAESDISRSEFFRECVETIQPVLIGVENIICLGLGNFHECVIARYQLAFIRCLRKQTNLDVKVQYFDPVFSRAEIDTLHILGETVLHENLEGKYRAEHKTLFFLPHCPKQIVNNLLWKNWDAHRLANVVLLCNSFSTVVNNNPDRLLRHNAGYILRAADLYREVPLRNSFRFTDIFNDTSLHYLPDGAVNSHIDWDCTEEPSYEQHDLELISKEVVATSSSKTLKHLLSELRAIRSGEGAGAYAMATKYITEQFRRYETTEQQHCRAKEELQFTAETYRCYLESLRKLKELNESYRGKGERTIRETADMVGFKLPHDPK
uniref:SRR1-like domain-containing protein n=1 Tax=Anopheles culicifacies TaxID=139723 RepID=A0A182MFH0_9DIPT